MRKPRSRLANWSKRHERPKRDNRCWPRHYKRQGALQLFAGLSVADGYRYGQTFERKCFVDFQAFLLGTIIPEALRRGVHTLKLILDKGKRMRPNAWKTGSRSKPRSVVGH